MRLSALASFLALSAAARAAAPAPVSSAPGANSGPSGCAKPPADGARVEDLAVVLEPLRQKHALPALGAAVVTPEGVKALGVVGFR